MAIKRSKFERKNARAARKTAAPVLDPNAPPPTPEETKAMAAQGIAPNRGSATEVPLSTEGEQEVQDTAEKLAAKGGLDSATASPSVRAQQTTEAIQDANPTPLEATPDANLESWAQGNLEGQPKALVKDQISDLIRNNPSQVIPGQGAATNRKGESFDQFRQRYLSSIRGAMQQLAENPTAKHGIVTHSMGIKLLRSWLANGSPDDLSIKPEAMVSDKSEKPGQVERLFPNKDGDWELNRVNLDSPDRLQPGLFLIRHGLTAWNPENYSEQGQDARAEIAQHAMNANFPALRAAAQKASAKKYLTDDEISDAIDGSLPSADDVQNMPPHQILAVASAASPAKRADYAPIVQNIFGNLATLPPDARHILQSHLGRIGMLNAGQGA